MGRRLTFLMQSVVSVVLLALLSGCGTLQYRSLQSDFNEAVVADNGWSVSPFGQNVAESLYTAVREELSDKYIDDLDARLQPNAWMLRAVCAWRTGQYMDAHSAATKGTAALNSEQLGSRDHVMLGMLDGMIVDAELRETYLALPVHGPKDRTLDQAAYQGVFEAAFATALSSLDASQTLLGKSTPPDVVWYYHSQRWRLLQNWRVVVNDIDDSTERVSCKGDAKVTLGGTFKDASSAARDAIPSSHPLHQLILAQGG